MKLKRSFILILVVHFGITEEIQAQKKGIDTNETILIGGIKQYIQLKSKDVTKPILLFLHGGPGESVMAIADTFTSKLQNEFIVVQWDQRGSGKTAGLNPSASPATLSAMKNDTYDVIQYLLKRYKQKKLYLVCHSFGTTLGFYIAQKHPELLYAFVAISPSINTAESERINLEKLKARAKDAANQQAIQELETVKTPYENWEQMFYNYKWMWVFDGKISKEEEIEGLKTFAKAWCAKWLTVYNEVEKQNFFKSIPALNCPVYFFVGRTDFQTNFAVTENYYTTLKAPKKRLFWFEKSGHNIPFSEPDLLQAIILKDILPETLNE